MLRRLWYTHLPPKQVQRGSNPPSCAKHFNGIIMIKKGSVGEIAAQLEFLKRGYEVYSPATDNTTFDFIVQKDGVLETVEVKTTTVRTPNLTGWTVQLKSTRPNRSGNTIKMFDNTKMDYLCVYLEPIDKVIIMRASSIKARGALVVYE